MLLSRRSVGTYPETNSHATCQGWPQLSQLAEPLWTDPCRRSGISAHELISTSKLFFRRGMIGRTFFQNPRKRGKSHHHHHQSELESDDRHMLFFLIH